jgi:hypothetical protein
MGRLFAMLAVLGCMGAVVASARAAETEIRTFAVSVNGKPCGQYKMTIQVRDDGMRVMSAEALVQAAQAAGWYLYGYSGKETWKDGRLQKLEAGSNDAGKKRVIEATAGPQNLRVILNGQRSDVRPDVWTTSFWFLPEESRRDTVLPMLDVNSGKVVQARLEKVAIEKLVVLGQPLECGHYRVKGESIQAELWYDGAERLIRMETAAEGRKEIMELSKVQR